MSERPTGDLRRPFLLLMGAIGVLIVLGLALLVTVVILQRAEPRRHGPTHVNVRQAARVPSPGTGLSPTELFGSFGDNRTEFAR